CLTVYTFACCPGALSLWGRIWPQWCIPCGAWAAGTNDATAACLCAGPAAGGHAGWRACSLRAAAAETQPRQGGSRLPDRAGAGGGRAWWRWLSADQSALIQEREYVAPGQRKQCHIDHWQRIDTGDHFSRYADA